LYKIKYLIDRILDIRNSTRGREELPEENVMLHIRARGLNKESRMVLVRTILISTFMGLLFDLLGIPITLFIKAVSVIITFVLVFGLWFFFSITWGQILVLTLCLLVIFNAKSSTIWAKHLLFDIADCITFASCTKWWLHVYLSQSRIHRNWLNEVDSTWAWHIYTSRLMWYDNPIQQEEDELFNNYDPSNVSEVEKMIDSYWNVHE